MVGFVGLVFGFGCLFVWCLFCYLFVVCFVGLLFVLLVVLCCCSICFVGLVCWLAVVLGGFVFVGLGCEFVW